MKTISKAPPGDENPPGAKLVKAIVRPGNQYGNSVAGEEVVVEPKELVICKHALVTPEAWAQEQAEAEAARKPKQDLVFENSREAFREAARASEEVQLHNIEKQKKDLDERIAVAKKRKETRDAERAADEQ